MYSTAAVVWDASSKSDYSQVELLSVKEIVACLVKSPAEMAALRRYV